MLAHSDDAWRASLDTFAERVSQGRWKPYDWSVYLAQELEAAINKGGARIIIEAPPQHGKSETGAQRLAEYFLEWNPEKYVAIGSYTSKLAEKRSRAVRDTFENESSDTWTNVNPDKRAAKEWETTQGGGCQAVGVGGSITGFPVDLMIIDDPHKGWAEVQSKTQRQKVIDWYKSDVYTRLQSGASVVLIQTRWNQGDLAGYLQSEEPGVWTVIRLPAIAEAANDDYQDPLGRAEGEPLCPERFTYDELMDKKRAVGPRVFAGLYQQRPAPAGGNIIKRDWIRYYGAPANEDDPNPKQLPAVYNVIQSWDLNMGEAIETKSSSYVVGQCWGRNGAHSYLLAQKRGKWSHVVNKRQVKDFREEWPECESVYIEKAASGRSLLADLENEVMGIVGVDVQGSKDARLESVSGMFHAGQVWFPHPSLPGCSWVPELVEEVVAFPGSDDSDQVDALSQALSQYKSTPSLEGMSLGMTGMREGSH